MDKLLTWIEQNKPDSIGHGRREDCARIKNEVFSLRGDYTTKTIKEKLLNMEKKFKKAQEIKFSAGTNDLSGIEDSAIKEKIEKLCPFYDRIERLKRMTSPTNPNRSLVQEATPRSVASDHSNESSGQASPPASVQVANVSLSSNLPMKDPSYLQFYPLDNSYTGQGEEEEGDEVDLSPHQQAQEGTPQMSQLIQNNILSRESQTSEARISDSHTQMSSHQPSPQSATNSIQSPSDDLNLRASQPVSSRNFNRSRVTQSQTHQSQLPASPILSQQQQHLSSSSYSSSKMIRTSSGGGHAYHRSMSSSTGSSASVFSGGSLDFNNLVSVLERREQRLESEMAERLELEKQRLEYTELMDQKRLEIEHARYKAEAERSKRIENILMTLVAQTRPTSSIGDTGSGSSLSTAGPGLDSSSTLLEVPPEVENDDSNLDLSNESGVNISGMTP